mmetsp:Transcript_15561/g.28243  ORF Transcript_15561/g.28243 Transcript_15561/m.28243 type:complete len:443 (-) Transcript_15561:186-1514(-)
MDKRNNLRYLLIAINVSLLSFWWGYQLGLSSIDDFKKFSFVFPIGAIGGSLISSMMAKCIGRLRLFSFCALFGLIASGLEAIRVETAITMSRFACGIVAGIISSYVPIYLSEITPREYVGRPAVINQTFITLGLFAAACMSKLSDDFYYFIILFPNFFSILGVVGMWTVFKYESPVYLWMTNRKDAAVKLIKKLANDSIMSAAEISEKEPSVIESERLNSTTELIRNPLVRRILLLTMTLSFFQQFTGINDILVYSELELLNDYTSIVLLGVGTVSAFITIYFIDRLKRLTLLKIGAVGMFLADILILVIWNKQVESYLAIVFIIFFETSIGPVMWLYISELASPVSMGISTACNWAGVLAISLLSSISANISHDTSENMRRGMYGVYCADCIFVLYSQIFVLAQFYLIETHDVALQDLERKFLSKSEIESKSFHSDELSRT